MAEEVDIEVVEEDTLWSDDLLPSEGGSGIFQPEPDEALVQELSDEKVMVQSAGPLIDTILNWFDHEIAWSKSIEGINLESEIPAAAQVLAKQRLLELLTESRQRLEILKDNHIKS